MMRESGKDVKKMHKIRTDESELEPYIDKYQEALEHLRVETEAFSEKQNRKFKNKRKRTVSKTSSNGDD